MVEPTCINSGTASTYLTMQYLGQLEQQVKIFLAAHAIATSNHNRSTLQVMLGSLHVVVEHFYYEGRPR